MMKPMMPMQMGPTMCQNFSPVRSACQALRREVRQAKTQGGALMRRVGIEGASSGGGDVEQVDEDEALRMRKGFRYLV